MRIEKLKLENFRSYASAEFAFERWNFLVGPNAVGKSSVQMAIEFLLTGKCRGTDAGGRGAEDLIRLGAKGLVITGELRSGMPQPWTVQRKKTARSHELELQAAGILPLPEAQKKLLARLATTQDVLSAVLDAGRFVEMSEADQKKLLTSVLGAQAATVREDIVKDMQFLGFVNAPATVESIAEIDKMHDHFFATRTAQKRALKELGELDRPEAPADMPDSKLVWKQLDDLRWMHADATGRRTARVRDYAVLKTRRADLSEEIARAEAAAKKRAENWASEHRARVQELELEATALREEALMPDEEADYQRIAAHAGRRDELVAEESRLATLIAEAEKAIEAMVALKGGKCPTCHRSLPLKAKGDAQNAIEREREGMTAQLEKVQRSIIALGDVDAAIEALEADARVRQSAEQARKKLAAAEAETSPQFADIEQQIAAAKKKLDSLPEMDEPNVADLDAEIAALSERIAKGEAILDQVKSVEAEQLAWKRYETKRQTLEGLVAALDRLCEYFGPNGVRSQMVGDRLKPFSEAMNAALQAFDYHVRFTMEPYQFLVTSAEGPEYATTRSLKMLSESERFRFGVAFQIALAKTTGLNFVVIDRADVLDGESRQALTQMLAASELEQAIVLSTSDAAIPPANMLPAGVKFFALGAREAVAA
jgi:AAA ATPase domain